MDIEKNLGLYNKMRSAIAQTTPELLIHFEKTLKDYDGDPRLLNLWLERFKNNNPYIATNGAILKRAIIRTPEEMEEMNAEDGQLYVVGESGHKLKNQLYLFVHYQDHTRTWKQGDTVLKIIEAFGNTEQKKAFTKEGQEEIIKKKKTQIKKSLEDVVTTLEEVLKDPSRVKDIQSIEDRRKVVRILGLDEEYKKRLLQIDKLIYGSTSFMDQEGNDYLIAADKGGMFYGKFERNLTSLPIEIRDIYTQVRNPHIEIPEDERKFMIGALIAWAAANTPISREAAIGGYQKDLDFIMKLPEKHPIIEKHGLVDLTSVRSILKKPEITLIDATRIFDVYPVDEVRFEFNKDYLSKFKEEFEYTINALKELYIQDGKFMRDMFGASIPMGRLNKDASSEVLTRDDYDVIRTVLRTKILTQAKEGRFFKVLPMEEFKYLIDSAALIARKLENREEMKNWQEKLNRKTGFSIVEKFELEHGLSLDELIKRAKRLSYNPVWFEHKNQIGKLAKIGLYFEKDIEKISGSGIIEKAKKLIPISEIQDDYQRAKKISESELIYYLKGHIPPEEFEFLDEKEVEGIRELLSVEDEINKVMSEYGPRAKELIKKIDYLKKINFYSAKINESIVLTEESLNFTNLYKEKEKVILYDLKNIEERIETIEREFVSGMEIEESWFEKAKIVTSDETSKFLKKPNTDDKTKKYINKISWKKKFRPSSYVEKNFIQEIENAHDALEKSYTFDDSIISKGLDLLKKGSLMEQYNVRVDLPGWFAKDFKKEVGGFYWPGKGNDWLSDNKSKFFIGEVAGKIVKFNKDHKTSLKLSIYTTK